MTLHVSLLGIDGSGKSTVARTLPSLLSAESGLTVGLAGEQFRLTGPEQDHVTDGFEPPGLPVTARLNAVLRWLTHQWVNIPALYAAVKLVQMIVQDVAARAMAARFRPDVMISDGNTVLCTAGRAANYLWPASGGRAADPEHVKILLRFLMTGEHAEPLPQLPRLGLARFICRVLRLFRVHHLLPDVVVFLDASPSTALARAAARGNGLDRHENHADMTQARGMYLAAMDVLRRLVPTLSVVWVDVEGITAAATMHRVVGELRPVLPAPRALGHELAPLGSAPRMTGLLLVRKLVSLHYVLGYLVMHALSDAWREPFFLFSSLGRRLLKEGYSAELMREIYVRTDEPGTWADRIFLRYPLHRAVYDRLALVTHALSQELERRLRTGGTVRVFTGPSGFSDDVMGALEQVRARMPQAMARVEVVAADLDPRGVLQPDIEARARALGVNLRFLRGDLTGPELRAQAGGRFDLAVFVGLSSWIPKPDCLRHLRWLRESLVEDGTLVTDCFTPAPYALSGSHMGYRASYYAPQQYADLVAFSGFDGARMTLASGRDGINHVLVAQLGLSATTSTALTREPAARRNLPISLQPGSV
ncbi:MAG: hypothetical protein AB2A00_28315 [Myxococcota bacterium]